MLSEVETSPGRVPLVCNYVIATNNFSRKERFREICSTSLRSARYDVIYREHYSKTIPNK